MKQMEDRIRDRLEGYESNLPEGDLAEFKALLDSAVGTNAKRRVGYLAWLAPAVIAACLAIFFILGHTSEKEIINVIDSDTLLADVIEPAVQDTIEKAAIDARTTVAGNRPHTYVQAPADKDEQNTPESICDDEKHAAESVAPGAEDSGNPNDSETYVGRSESHSQVGKQAVSMNMGRATAGILGGAGALALSGMLPALSGGGDAGFQPQSTVDPFYTVGSSSIDERTKNDTHHMPLRAGLSLRIPFSEMWSLTTGLDYYWYSSTLGYSISGDHKQNVHYLGIPFRADYALAGNRLVDIYIGAGASVDFCVAAFEDGNRISKDGVGFALIGAGGIQFKVSKDVSLFIDPTLSWNIPSERRVLDTYKTEHPFMFTVPSGIRVTLENKK